MNKKNLILLTQMKRLSRIIRSARSARRDINFIMSETNYFIVEGRQSNFIGVQAKASSANILYIEQYLRLSVSEICKDLDGFDVSRMEPIDYISSSDVKNGSVAIMLGKKIVADIDLSTGFIKPAQPESDLTGED